MTRAAQQGAFTGVVSLGLLASRLRLALLRNVEHGAPQSLDAALLDQWHEILQETVVFLQGRQPRDGSVGDTEATSAPRFLTRARYLHEFRDAVPERNKSSMNSMATYLSSMSDSISLLQEGRQLPSRQRDSLVGFSKRMAVRCEDEAARLQGQTHYMKPSEFANE